MNQTLLALTIIFTAFTTSAEGEARSFIHRGSSSSCSAACEDARDMARLAHESACNGDYDVTFDGAPYCSDGGDYDVNCTFATEIRCNSTLEPAVGDVHVGLMD